MSSPSNSTGSPTTEGKTLLVALAFVVLGLSQRGPAGYSLIAVGWPISLRFATLRIDTFRGRAELVNDAGSDRFGHPELTKITKRVLFGLAFGALFSVGFWFVSSASWAQSILAGAIAGILLAVSAKNISVFGLRRDE